MKHNSDRRLGAGAGIMILTTVLGMLWGVAYLLGRRGLIPCMVAHFLNDATPLSWEFFPRSGCGCNSDCARGKPASTSAGFRIEMSVNSYPTLPLNMKRPIQALSPPIVRAQIDSETLESDAVLLKI